MFVKRVGGECTWRAVEPDLQFDLMESVWVLEGCGGVHVSLHTQTHCKT
jgi:hypothetical protein